MKTVVKEVKVVARARVSRPKREFLPWLEMLSENSEKTFSIENDGVYTFSCNEFVTEDEVDFHSMRPDMITIELLRRVLHLQKYLNDRFDCSGVYFGVTSDIAKRYSQHKLKRRGDEMYENSTLVMMPVVKIDRKSIPETFKEWKMSPWQFANLIEHNLIEYAKVLDWKLSSYEAIGGGGRATFKDTWVYCLFIIKPLTFAESQHE